MFRTVEVYIDDEQSPGGPGADSASNFYDPEAARHTRYAIGSTVRSNPRSSVIQRFGSTVNLHIHALRQNTSLWRMAPGASRRQIEVRVYVALVNDADVHISTVCFPGRPRR